MQRFFVTFPLNIDVVLSDSGLVNQISRVLRMKEGESVILFDGDGSETIYEIQEIAKKTIHLRGKERYFPNTEPKKNITLCQALPNKYEKIEFILQKWIEVGIKKFFFFRSERSQKLMLSDAKKERFTLIAKEALEQCWGVIFPEIIFLETFPEVTPGANLVLDTVGKESYGREFLDIQDMVVWVGPEWGWSEGERTNMNDYDFIFVHFWRRVLRTETAGVVTAFSLIYQ